MRIHFWVAVAVVGAAASIGVTPTSVQARDYPFCIKGFGYASPIGDCSFDTYQQCLATASGRFDYCDVNPFFDYPKQPAFAYAKKRSKRH
jgi:hypothetical protein